MGKRILQITGQPIVMETFEERIPKKDQQFNTLKNKLFNIDRISFKIVQYKKA
jgi:hypothetical protein